MRNCAIFAQLWFHKTSGNTNLIIQDPPSSNSGRPWHHSNDPLWSDPCQLVSCSVCNHHPYTGDFFLFFSYIFKPGPSQDEWLITWVIRKFWHLIVLNVLSAITRNHLTDNVLFICQNSNDDSAKYRRSTILVLCSIFWEPLLWEPQL